jgi:integrase
LQVGDAEARSWIFRFQMAGTRRSMGLGSADLVSLAEAREKAIDARRVVAGGNDPIEARRIARAAERAVAAKAMTFQECAEACINARKAGWKNAKHAAQWRATLESYVYPVFGDLDVQAVDTVLVMKVIEPLWTEKPETGSRVRGRVETVLDWATVCGHRTGENPARWKGHLDQLLPPVSKAKRAKRETTGRGEHHPAMPYGEIGAFMPTLRERKGVSARALEFTIVTAKRTKEVVGARAREFDFSERMWTVPAGRMKGEREHRVPLSNAAIAVLTHMRIDPINAPDEFVFPGLKSGLHLNPESMRKFLQHDMGYEQYTVHGFRSTFRDWAAERTNFANEVAEMALAHVVDDKVEAAYRRGDLLQKRRHLADAWAKFCTTAPVTAGERVVTLRR